MEHVRRIFLIALCFALSSQVGCAKIESGEEDIDASTDLDTDVDTDVDSDTDTDTDTDTDSDTDTDTDTDSDTDTGTDTGEDPCEGMMCDDPPADQCADESTLWVYESPGECVEELDGGPDAGSDAGLDAGMDGGPDEGPFCVYGYDEVDCVYGCADAGCNLTECTVGDCCVSGFYADTDLQCGFVEVDVEYGCETADCAADARQRFQFQYCTGESADCTMGNLVWHGWEVIDDCTADEICESDFGGAWCTDCEFGCTDGQCDLDPCLGVICETPDDDYCLDADNLRDYASTGTCVDGDCEYGYTDIWCTYGCENQTGDDICGGDPCLGVTCFTPPVDYCVDGDTVRQYEDEGFCSNGICDYPFADVYCPYGCTLGVCDPPDCTSGVCCSGGFFRPATYLCSSWYEYQCTGDWCGADPRTRTASQYCSGTSATCNGSITNGSWTATANCGNEEICEFDESDSWCVPCEFGCTGGVCEDDPCEGVTCTTPPSNFCADANNVTVYNVPGTCSGGTCSYTTHNEFCSFGCTGGACDGDPCLGVNCNTPPPAICVDADTRRVYNSTGTCVGGICQYGYLDSDCEYGCTLGVCNPPDCSSGPCCTGGHFDTSSKTCNTWTEAGCTTALCSGDPRERPVTQYCSGTSSLCNGSIVNGSWATTGSCTASEYCDFDIDSAWCVECEFGCSAGGCLPDPCLEVTCNTPPANFCADATNLAVYNVPGTCSGGTCSYTTHNEFCTYGCTAGSCDGDPCQGVTCLSPPADTCVDANTKRHYNSPGTCSGGVCSYTYTDSACTYGCSGGVCDPPDCTSGVCCAGGFFRPDTYACNSWTEYGCTSTSCGADARQRAVTRYCTGSDSTCVGAVVNDTWTPVEACSATQICEYDTVGAWCTDCPFGCSLGACLPDPCLGVTCLTPPANFCADSSNLTVYDVPGTCSGGTCSYTTHNQFCSFGCSAGQCLGDPCLGVNCLSPPADYCVNTSTLREYNSPGTCSGGVCSYSYTDTSCTYGCEFGACVVPECTTGVCCDTVNFEYRPSSYACGSGMDYGCAGSACGSDGQERPMTQYCSGSSINCDGTKNYGSWTTTDFCTLDQLCQSNTTNAWCVDCEFGCTLGACDGDPCEGVNCVTPPANYCADASNLTVYDVPGTCSGGTCSYTTHNQFCSFGCSGGACVGDPCLGVTCLSPPADYCVDANTKRHYNSPGTCSGGVCSYTYTDSACTYGCSGGVCNPAECTSGPCCNGGFFRPASYVCATSTEYGCSGTDCGSDGRSRPVSQYCSGSSALCNGSVTYGGWTVTDACTASQICQYNTTDAWCFTCTEGCSAGECNSTSCGLAVNEPFNTSTLPTGWAVYDGDGYLGADGYTWQWANTSPPPGGSGGYWWVDSDGPGSIDMYEGFYSAWYDGTGCDTATLQFDHYYHYFDEYEWGAVMMTSDGSTWHTLAVYELADNSGHKSLNLHPELWTSGSFRVKWLYSAYYDWYWKVDNVQMTGTP